MSDTILTPFQTCGPLFGFALFPEGVNASAAPADAETITLEGVVLDGAGEHVGYGSFVECWSAGQATRARTLNGRYRITMSMPQAEKASGPAAFAACLHMRIFTRGLALPLLTRVYFPNPALALDDDPVLARVAPELRERLIARPAEGARHFVHDIHLQGPKESVFFALQAP